jgi:hypothetical protein
MARCRFRLSLLAGTCGQFVTEAVAILAGDVRLCARLKAGRRPSLVSVSRVSRGVGTTPLA